MTAVTLATRARRLLELMTVAQEKDEEAQARNVVESASARAGSSHARLSAILACKPSLAAHGIVFPPLPIGTVDEISTAKRTLRLTATTIERNEPRSAATRIKSQSVDTALGTCEKIAKMLESQLTKATNRKRQELLPLEIDSPVTGYPGISEALIVRLRNIQRTLTSTIDDVRVDQLAERLDKIHAQVEQWALDFPRLEEALEKHHPEIKEFLSLAVTEEGAPWTAITPRVLQWLSDPDHTADLKVVLRQ